MSTEICTLEQKIKRLEVRQEELRFALGTAVDALKPFRDVAYTLGIMNGRAGYMHFGFNQEDVTTLGNYISPIDLGLAVDAIGEIDDLINKIFDEDSEE
jgi:hypothetical protein